MNFCHVTGGKWSQKFSASKGKQDSVLTFCFFHALALGHPELTFL